MKTRPKRRPPTRRLMRHILRARVEAVKALAGFFDQLDRAGPGKQVKASGHLARRFGSMTTAEGGLGGADGAPEVQGLRDAKEVIAFLKQRGAKIPMLSHANGEWAALSSEGENTPFEEKEDIVWVPRTS